MNKAFEVEKTLSQAQAVKKVNQAWMKKQAKRSHKQVDQDFHAAHEEVFDTYDCLSCANCCKTTSPIFRPADIERLAKHLGIKPVEFQIEHLIIDEDGDFVLHTSPCTFLNEDNTCSVYEHRPKACREYPHTDRKNMHQILNLTLKNTLVCPAVQLIVKKIQTATTKY